MLDKINVSTLFLFKLGLCYNVIDDNNLKHYRLLKNPDNNLVKIGYLQSI